MSMPGFRWRWVILAAAVSTALLVWQLRGSPSDDAAVASVAKSTAATPKAAAASPSVQAVPRTTAPTLQPGKRMLCGHGPYRPSQATLTGLPPEIDQAARKALAALPGQLAGGDERDQARGLALQVMLTRYAAPTLGQNADAATAMANVGVRHQAEAASQPARASLVRLAQGSRDADVYRQAFLACKSLAFESDAHCGQLTAREWARRAPSDGLAWAFAADEAHAAKDAAALDDAVYRLSQATGFSSTGPGLTALIDDPGLRNQAMPVQVGAAMQLAVLGGTPVMPPFHGLLDYCRADSIADPTRRQRCHEAARTLAARDPTPLSLVVADTLGQRIGWSATDLQRLRDEREALQWADLQWSRRLDDAGGCESFAALRPLLALAHGPRHQDMLRRRMSDEGVSSAVLAQRFRDAMRARETDARSLQGGAAAPTQGEPGR